MHVGRDAYDAEGAGIEADVLVHDAHPVKEPEPARPPETVRGIGHAEILGWQIRRGTRQPGRPSSRDVLRGLGRRHQRVGQLLHFFHVAGAQRLGRLPREGPLA